MTPTGPSRRDERSTVTVDGRTLSVSNLEKPLYPDDGTTKAEVMQYYVAVASVLLPQLADRPLTRIRWPNGTGAPSFFEKSLPAGTPDWVRRVTLPVPGSTKSRETVTFPIIEDLAGLTWLANLGSLELHVPQWRVDNDGDPLPPDRMVIDLDPGPGVGLSECAKVALLVRALLDGVGVCATVPVTSGSKGMQVYAAMPGTEPAEKIRDAARALAETLAISHADLVVSRMTKSLRAGKVLLDWSQNTAAKTTICPYSLRGKGRVPLVAAPRTWAEIEAASGAGAGENGGSRGAEAALPLRQLAPHEVRDVLETDGDRMAALE